MNVIVKENKKSKSVLEFFKDADVDGIREEFKGLYVEETKDVYSKKWGEWWLSGCDDF